MPDALFADPHLARLYDLLEDDRSDLDAYEALVDELGASSVLDIGCGTGSLACRLEARGVEVVGLDPAAASLAVARAKPGAERVRWIEGDVDALPPLAVDLAVMTGNVAMVFLDDATWKRVVAAAHRSLRPGGWLVFETRDRAARSWEAWTPEATFLTVDTPDVGPVDSWVEVTEVRLPFVSFRYTFRFRGSGVERTSESTLRFRSLEEAEASLRDAGFVIGEVRDAPDRPGLEHVVLARRDG